MSEKKQKAYDPLTAPFSWDKLEGLLACKSSLVMCADILEVHENTIKNHIKKRYQKTFTDYALQKLSRTKLKLVQTAIKQASAGNTVMLIFCLKNLCSWADKNHEDVEEISVTVNNHMKK